MCWSATACALQPSTGPTAAVRAPATRPVVLPPAVFTTCGCRQTQGSLLWKGMPLALMAARHSSAEAVGEAGSVQIVLQLLQIAEVSYLPHAPAQHACGLAAKE